MTPNPQQVTSGGLLHLLADTFVRPFAVWTGLAIVAEGP